MPAPPHPVQDAQPATAMPRPPAGAHLLRSAAAGMLLVLLTGLAAEARGTVAYLWRDDFSAAEREKLTAWVGETVAALETLVGPFPMDVRVYIHRRDDASEPVPWANTQRYRGQGVHFHVDPDYPLRAFREDWTAPHELSHLILPYLGDAHAWFAEGFASYMQYQVMEAQGVLTAGEAARRYRRNFEAAERGYDYGDRTFPEAAPKLRAERKYPVMYWGGAAYFMQVDDALQHSGSSLAVVLRRYLACCRRNHGELEALLTELDRIAGADTFRQLHQRLLEEPGFPTYPRGG